MTQSDRNDAALAFLGQTAELARLQKIAASFGQHALVVILAHGRDEGVAKLASDAAEIQRLGLAKATPERPEQPRPSQRRGYTLFNDPRACEIARAAAALDWALDGEVMQ